MRILLLGEYSNVHATLAEGLRELGHEVVVVSDGDYIYHYKTDIPLCREGKGKWSAIKYVTKLLMLLPKLRRFDIVQLVNPDFLSLKAERQLPVYRYLRHNNRRVVLGAFGNDWQWVHSGLNERLFRYGDFYIGDTPRENAYARMLAKEWIGTMKGELSQMVAKDCDAIVPCLYEYDKCYRQVYPEKTHFIPLPVKTPTTKNTCERETHLPIKFFIGIKRHMMDYKGTDIMLEALNILKERYPDRCEVSIAEDLPFEQYMEMMSGNDVILDQLYSYTPAMNALQAMAMGLVCMGGGEPENYEILHEKDLKPIINIQPSLDDTCRALEQLIMNPHQLSELKRQSIQYVERHHHYLKVAHQYADLYQHLLKDK